MISTRGAVYKIWRIGPRTEPYGTLCSSLMGSDWWLLIITNWKQSVRCILSQLRTVSLMPNVFWIQGKKNWIIYSVKAADRSRRVKNGNYSPPSPSLMLTGDHSWCGGEWFRCMVSSTGRLERVEEIVGLNRVVEMLQHDFFKKLGNESKVWNCSLHKGRVGDISNGGDELWNTLLNDRRRNGVKLTGF